MIQRLTVVVISVLATAAAAPAGPLSVKLATGETAVLLGVDEMTMPYCVGQAANAIAAHAAVRVEKDPEVKDGSVYAYTAQGAMINAIALESGCAWPTPPAKALYAFELHQAFFAAQASSRGRYKVRQATAEEIAALKALPSGAATTGTGNAMGSWSGSGIKDTESFTTTSGEWRIVWRASSTSRVGGTLSVMVYNEAGQMITSVSSGDVQGTRSDSSVVRAAPGRYYLKILSANCTWDISATR